MMKINERVITGYTSDGKPITAIITRDMTPEELSMIESSQYPGEPTDDERLKAIESAIIELAQEVGKNG